MASAAPPSAAPPSAAPPSAAVPAMAASPFCASGTFGEVRGEWVDGTWMAVKRYRRTGGGDDGVPPDAVRELLILPTVRDEASVVSLLAVRWDDARSQPPADGRRGGLVNSPRVVMPMAHGTLWDVMRRDGIVPWQLALGTGLDGVALALWSAVRHLHLSGVAHRDLKPSNILVYDRQLRLADFGSATLLLTRDDGRTTRFSAAVCTYSYSAPEMLARGDYSAPECDVWSLGVVLAELHSMPGRVLFHFADDGTTNEARALAKITKEHDYLRAALPSRYRALVCWSPEDRRSTLRCAAPTDEEAGGAGGAGVVLRAARSVLLADEEEKEKEDGAPPGKRPRRFPDCVRDRMRGYVTSSVKHLRLSRSEAFVSALALRIVDATCELFPVVTDDVEYDEIAAAAIVLAQKLVSDSDLEWGDVIDASPKIRKERVFAHEHVMLRHLHQRGFVARCTAVTRETAADKADKADKAGADDERHEVGGGGGGGGDNDDDWLLADVGKEELEPVVEAGEGSGIA